MVDKKSSTDWEPLPILGDVQKNVIIHNVLDKCVFGCLYCTKRITWMPQMSTPQSMKMSVSSSPNIVAKKVMDTIEQ